MKSTLYASERNRAIAENDATENEKMDTFTTLQTVKRTDMKERKEKRN